MQREIKFRGKRLDNGEWVYGDLLTPKSINYHCCIRFDDKYGDKHTIIVDSATVGQYTGLKDKNGREIYEGDILQRPSTINKEFHGEWIRDEVIYKPGTFFTSHITSEKGNLPRGYTAGELLEGYFEYDGKLFAFSKDYEPYCLGEVISNIHDTPNPSGGSDE